MVINTGMFIDRLAIKSGYRKSDCKDIVDYFVSVLCDSLKSGDSINLRGFFNLGIKRKGEHSIRHPTTGELLTIEESFLPSIHFGKYMLEAANSHRDGQINVDSGQAGVQYPENSN